MNARLVRSVRWGLATGWLGSLVWLAGCLSDLLGWRGPGAVLVAWSVPTLPLFVLTAEFCGPRRWGVVEPAVPAIVVAWVSLMWWVVATPLVPRSPLLFIATAAVVGVAALALIAWQGAVVWSWRPAVPAHLAPEAQSARRVVRVRSVVSQAHNPRRARPASVATLPRAG